MTTVAWTKGQLAADRQATEGDLSIEVSKLHIHQDVVISYAGVYEEGQQFVDWYFDREGRCPLRKTDAMIMDLKTGECYTWEAKGKEERLVVDEYASIGSGSHLAIGALEAGASLKEAVEIAIKRDVNSGFGVDIAAAKNYRRNK